MSRHIVTALALSAALSLPSAARAQSNEVIEEIRREIQNLKDSYESRIEALEQRLKEAEGAAAEARSTAAEAQAAAAEAAAAQPTAATPAAVSPTPGRISDNAFNPAISVILQGVYADFEQSPHDYAVTGFADPDRISPGERGLSLGESELNFSANIDHLFYGNLLIGFHEDEVHVEEAYFQTLALGGGVTVKGGRFFSGIGYQNTVHSHAWDFVDAALVQRSLLGNNYGDDGLQVTWIAPLPLYVELGAELGRGRTLPGAFEEHTELAEVDREKNGIGATAFFARLGGDIGTSHSYRIGASHLRTETDDGNPFPLADFDTRTGTTNLFTGDVEWYGIDLVYKWAPDGNPAQRNFKLVAEWMTLRRSGAFAFDVDPGGPGGLGLGPVSDAFKLRQSGWYVQGVYQFHPQWRAGLRYDRLDAGSFDGGANAPNVPGVGFNPKRWSAMVDWNPSEFSRVRLQYNDDKSQLGIDDKQFFLQYIYSLGVHGAHKF